MRQLHIRVPRGQRSRVADIAREHDGVNMAVMAATAGDKEVDLVFLDVGNAQVEPLLGRLEAIPDLHVTLAPRGVITLRPPPSEAPEQALDVAPLSPIEVYLGGLQSIGAWKGFLGYAVAAGFVVWIALFTETVYLLTAAMLIAPFAGPAMNAALATARGDAHLLGRSVLRYFAALGATIAVAFLLSLVMGQTIATGLMVDQSAVSSVAVLLPLVAGAAGALNLCQSERSSLVSGAATGMLVAASLAPPAGLVGMAAAIGEWGMVGSAAFLLFLQIVGINLAGSIVFRLYGVSPEGARFERGKGSVRYASWAATLAAGVALVAWQFSSSPDLLRSSQAQRAVADARQVIEESGLARPIAADAHFARTDMEGRNTLLVTAHVEAVSGSDELIESALTRRIKQRLAAGYNATPLVEVTVLRE